MDGKPGPFLLWTVTNEGNRLFRGGLSGTQRLLPGRLLGHHDDSGMEDSLPDDTCPESRPNWSALEAKRKGVLGRRPYADTNGKAGGKLPAGNETSRIPVRSFVDACR